MTEPRPCRQFRTPGGIPASSKISISSAPRIAEGSAGFMITVLPATIEDGGHALEQLAAFFEWRAAPRLKRASRRFRCALGFGNSGLSNQANDLIWRARIQRRQQLVGPNFFAINHEWVLLSETRTHFAHSGAHFFLGLGINKICQRSILVGIAGWHLAVGAVAT